ncbi:hypothetical protein KCP71_09110 [Salmonella enterica subsp. enterica]|nr:hypothetical protein KCP71_09110 [Salmonella enterica subsp. enterica]
MRPRSWRVRRESHIYAGYTPYYDLRYASSSATVKTATRDAREKCPAGTDYRWYQNHTICASAS